MAGYLGASPVPQTIQKKQSFTATASQTTFTTTGYTDGAFINVYLNGVRLINGTDYTATNGSDIVLTSAASASDVLDFETFNEFTLVDQTLETPTFRTSATLKNDTHEDTDGGRESTLIFKGEQSGGEISTLAEIEASHDGTADDEKGDLIFRTNDGSDGSSPTEAARIDSSQNLLVGKTSSSLATDGIEAKANGSLFVTRSSATPVSFRRSTDDGAIANFYKDGTTVGSIGTRAGRIKIGDGDVGLFFDNSNNRINPEGPSDSSANDNAIDLGGATQRFKDLYLSGGAYIGGTAAANKLDDYEEGTWTASLHDNASAGNASSTTQTGYYTKIGDMVFFNFKLVNVSTSGLTSSNQAYFSLPFVAAGSDKNDAPVVTVLLQTVNWSGSHTDVTSYVADDASRFRFYVQGDNLTYAPLLVSEITSGQADFYVRGQYKTV